MASAVAAVIAVAGTLLGSSVTYWFQRRTSAGAAAQEFARQLRAERVAAYSGYVTAVTLFRRGQLEWLNRRVEDPDGAVTVSARADAYRLRGEAQAALSRVRLAAGDKALVDAAGEALEAAEPMHYAADKDDLEVRNEEAKRSLQAFIDLAAAEVQSGQVT